MTPAEALTAIRVELDRYQASTRLHVQHPIHLAHLRSILDSVQPAVEVPHVTVDILRLALTREIARLQGVVTVEELGPWIEARNTLRDATRQQVNA